MGRRFGDLKLNEQQELDARRDSILAIVTGYGQTVQVRSPAVETDFRLV
jgi:hypothetical protein